MAYVVPVTFWMQPRASPYDALPQTPLSSAPQSNGGSSIFTQQVPSILTPISQLGSELPPELANARLTHPKGAEQGTHEYNELRKQTKPNTANNASIGPPIVSLPPTAGVPTQSPNANSQFQCIPQPSLSTVPYPTAQFHPELAHLLPVYRSSSSVPPTPQVNSIQHHQGQHFHHTNHHSQFPPNSHNIPVYAPMPSHLIPPPQLHVSQIPHSSLTYHHATVPLPTHPGVPQTAPVIVPLRSDPSEVRGSCTNSLTSSPPELDPSTSSPSSSASSTPRNSPEVINTSPVKRNETALSLQAEKSAARGDVVIQLSNSATTKYTGGNSRIGKQPVRDPVKLKHRVWLQQNRVYQDKLHAAGFRVLEGSNGTKICSLCKKQFPKEMFVWRHALNHVDEKPFHCTVCDQKFTRSDTLQRHIRRAGHQNIASSVC